MAVESVSKLLLLALLVVPMFGGARANAQPFDVRVLSAVGSATPDPSEKRVAIGTPVVLHLAVRSEGRLFAGVPTVSWDKKDLRSSEAQPPDEGWSVRWFRIEVAQRSLSNTEPSFHWESIAYRDVPMPACDDRWSCPAVVQATLLADRGGLGTMAFKAEVSWGEQRAASVGSEKRFRGGLTDEVARVTVRRDDSYLGLLTELFNTPYIWGSAGTPDAIHQAERRIGSDCADFVTYGVRRLGHSVPYTSTWTLPEHAREIAASDGPNEDGVYLDANAAPLLVGEAGARPCDLLLFRGHVGAFAKDEAPLGVLSTTDLMLHTCWAEPAEESIAASGYGNRSLRVLRWRVLER